MFRKFPGGPVLVLLASTSGTGLIPDPGTKIPHATCHGQKKKAETFNQSIFEEMILKVGCDRTDKKELVMQIIRGTI